MDYTKPQIIDWLASRRDATPQAVTLKLVDLSAADQKVVLDTARRAMLTTNYTPPKKPVGRPKVKREQLSLEQATASVRPGDRLSSGGVIYTLDEEHVWRDADGNERHEAVHHIPRDIIESASRTPLISDDDNGGLEPT